MTREQVDALVEERLALIRAKDFAGADSIRLNLEVQGIQLMDGKNDKGERITTWEVRR